MHFLSWKHAMYVSTDDLGIFPHVWLQDIQSDGARVSSQCIIINIWSPESEKHQKDII